MIPYLVLLLGLPGALAAQGGEDPGSSGPIIVLVRHAEKAADHPTDPSLTREGHARAAELARLLGRSDVTAVLSSDYRRTRDTAAPLADRLGIEVELYDAGALDALATELLGRTGSIVVVGHSNTTPELVTLLGGDPGEPIDDAEYDRLYVVHPVEGGPSATLVLRFGRPWEGAPARGNGVEEPTQARGPRATRRAVGPPVAARHPTPEDV
jgi:phosphohistidine phosphatase SixA